MPIYYVKGETYDIPDDKAKEFEARYPESAVEYENGSDRYRIPIDKREGFLKRFPDARIASLKPEINPAWKSMFTTPNPEILNYETPMSADDKRKFDRELSEMGDRTQSMIDDANSRIDNLRQFGLHTGSAVKKGKPIVDAQGNVVDTYVTASGGRYTDKNMAHASEYVPDRQPEYAEGFGAGFEQGWQGLKEGAKYFAGETANLFTGSSLDDKKALATLERLQAEGKTDVLRSGSTEVVDKSTLQDIALIRDVIEEAGGDMDKAKQILSERADELSWGDKRMESAREGMSKMKPTKGFGAWVGNLIPQMLPGAAAIALSFVTKNPKYAKMIGGVNLGGMSASTAGQSMMEAREAGASNAETWAVGIADGVIEAATEKIPYDKYTKKLFNGVKHRVGGEMADVVNNVSSPGRAELEQLLTKANKKLGGKLFSGKNVKEYLASIAAEGASEFTAEALQAITPIIYEEPENYPVLTDILSNGWEGAKAGLFMGSVLGGASKIAEHRQQRARRKGQGYVDVAQVHMGKNDEVVEIVGFDDKTGDYQVLHDGKVRAVKRDDVVESHRFTFDEFDNAELDMEADESYENGYSLHTQQEMTDAKNMYEYQRMRMAKELGVEAEQLDDMIGDPLDFIHRHREWGTPDAVIQTALDYANAKYTVEGMKRRVNDDIESRVAMSNEQIDQRTHRNDGMVHPAIMQLNDRAVHIIDGNIVMTDDGTMVDSRRSDATIIIRDAATGKVEFAAPEAILNVQEPIYAAEEKIAAEEQIRQQFMQEYENKASGRITAWNEGDTYTIADETGKPVQVRLVANELSGVVDNGDTVNATVDGRTVIEVPKKQIQQAVDEANKARVASYAATNEAKEAEEKAATPSYDYDYRVSLQAGGKNVSGRIAEITADGDIVLDELSSPINGKQSPKLTKAELDGMVVSVQDAEGNSVWKREESVLKNAENVPENAENVQYSPISVPKSEDNADLMPLTKDGEPDFYASSPQRSHKFIYEESGLDRNEANEFVQLQLDQANKALEKVKKSSQPKMGTSIMKYKQAKEQHQKLVDEAQNTVDYWKAVRAKQAEISKAEREEMAQKEAALRAEAVEQANAEREAQRIAEEERAAVGNENPMPAITEKWAKANKVDGIQDEIVLPNGERIKGHYVLHESGASSASHQATNGFQKTDGFPMDEAGNTVNDRDYEGDKEAQDVTRGIASKYDQRALQTPVVVSQDGVVLSGNGRTMAGELAALDGTDSAYNEYLKQYSSKFGFSPEQVSQMQHPRVAFVPDQRMPYTAETFAKFNQQDMKAQNKTEQAVKLGKIVSDEVLAGILRTMNTYDTLGDFYNDASVSSQIVNMLVRDNVVPQAQVAEMYDGNKLSVVGREMLENILIGKSFEGTPDIVRMLTSIPSMRQSVMFALSEISNNLMLGSDYTLKSEIAEAIRLCYEARNKGGVQFGDDVTSYARQLNLFADSLQTVADYNNATIMMLANAINDKRISQLKKVLASYNGMAMDSATGQLNLFTGELRERNSIINDVLNLLNNGTEQQINAAGQAATEKRKDSAAAFSENGASSQSDGTGTANERGGQGTDENTGRRQQNNLSEETGENKISARLSEDEIDEYGKSLVLAADSSTTFGLIAPESGLVVAPIKLSLGENYLGNDGRNHGYGLLHIEAGHGEQIREAGYDSVQQFVEEVAKNYTEIKEGALIGTHQTYLLEVSNEHNDTLFIQLSNDGTYWNVNSAGIFKKKYSRRKQKVYSVPAVGESTITDTSEVDNGQSMGETEPAGNSSESKDSKTSLNTSKIEENNSPSIEVNRNLEEDSSIEDSSEQPSVQTKIEAAEAETNTDPTEAQKKAGNYKMGHVQIGNFDISIENPAGSERKGVDANGNPWSTKMANTYGYMRGTEGVDGNHIDVFLANDMDAWNGRKVFVVDQYNEDGSFDEHKVMLGFNEQEDAETAYFANYEKDWGKKHKTVVTPVNLEDFEKWIDSSHRKTKAFAEYKSVKSQNHLLDDVEVSGIINAMKDNATVIPFIEITDSNWRDSINTPIGSVKMGENQRTKLFNKGREQQYGMLVESLSNPDIILEEKDKETDMFHERPSSYLFVKTFIKENGEKYVHFESVTVSQEGLEVSVSSHIIRENQLKNKLKSDRLLYKATALDEPANSSAEQPTNTGGSLSSENKDNNFVSEKQADGLKSSEAKNESDKFGERVRVEDAEFPKGLSEEVVVTKNQKGGKRSITENVSVAMVNGDLYVKRYVRGDNRRNVSLRIPGAKKYDFNEIKYRLELGIGTSTDAVRLMGDAIDELYKRGDFHEGILEKAERIAKEFEERTKKQAEAARKTHHEVYPISTSSRWGKVYQWSVGSFKDAVDFLMNKKDGMLKGVFYRDEIGEIGVGWGVAPNDFNGRGLSHIVRKHVNKLHDFSDVDEMIRVVEDVINHGVVRKDKDDSYAIENDTYRVVVVKDEDGAWVLSAFDYVNSKKEKAKRKDTAALGTPGQSNVEAGAVTSNLSGNKDNELASEKQLLNENEIRESPFSEIMKDGAMAYINGNINFATSVAYQQIYNYVWNRSENNQSYSTGRSAAQRIAAVDEASGGRGGLNGVQTGRMAGETDQPGGSQNSKRVGVLSDRAGSDTAVRGEISADGGLPSGDTGRKGGSRTGSKGDNVRKPESERGSSGTVGESVEEGSDSSNRGNIESCKDELKALLLEYEKASKKGLSLSVIGMNAEQIEIAGKILVAGVKLGYAYLKAGIIKFEHWNKVMHNDLALPFATSMHLSNAEIDEFIGDMWEYPYKVDGETRLLREWASIIGKAELRKKVGESLEEKRKAQAAAEPVAVKVCDRDNIAETLPFLLPQQQDDVLKAETQFFDESHNDREHAFGKGYMFTNGTGTGKTYTGLGIVKRFIKQGKGRILILTPSQTKVGDWVKDAKNLGIDLNDLNAVANAKKDGTTATTEKGEGAVITTYANFRQNKALLEDLFDLIVYDESHRLLENKEGTGTAGSLQHYKLSNRNEQYAYLRLQEIDPTWNALNAKMDEFNSEREKLIERLKKEYGITNELTLGQREELPPVFNGNWAGNVERKFPKLAKLRNEVNTLGAKYEKEIKPKLKEEAKANMKHTKVVFLSATPFNTRENLDYAEGYIFSYPEQDKPMGFANQSPRSQFYLEHFGAGYRWRYNRLESSSSNAAAVSKQEVEFSDYLQHTLQTMSGRVIDSPYDYSRDFPTVTMEKAEAFNSAMEELSRDGATRAGYDEVMGDYNYTSALFESMKVYQIIPRLKAHLERGRKVVVFHRRVDSKEPLRHPFAAIFAESMKAAEHEYDAEKKAEKKKRIASLKRKYADLLAWEQGLDLRMPREQLADAFGKDEVLFFSGKEGEKAKKKAVKDFNSDTSGKNIMVIQEASGKEGISLHDTTGGHQRVLVTLALPQSPITALQIEGRIYRIGNKSNAIFEYPLLGLNAEMMLFGQKFNEQVSTTENLALGSQARNLRESFARGVEEHSGDVDIDGQGVGGKELDAPSVTETDAFDRAVLDYYTNQKLTGRRDSRAGQDYYPTPEPLGYMMNQWGRIGEGESVLEPSAGHGAIARYVPRENPLTAVEPSQSLFSKLQIKAGGNGRKFENDVFENYNVANKHDVVLMNPPFGVGGRMAVDHVAKAFQHLDEGGRVVAIIPRGSTDKKFEKWYEGQKDAVLTAEIGLPDITFERAGTSVNCRVVVIDKVTNKDLRGDAASRAVHVDLSGQRFDKIEDFFEEIRNIRVPERTIDYKAKMKKKAAPVARELREMKGIKKVELNEDRIFVDGRGVWASMQWGDWQGDALTRHLANEYARFRRLEEYAADRENNVQIEVYGELKELCCKLAGMTEDEMQRYIERSGKDADEDLYREDDDLEEVNERFNEQLESLTEENAQGVILDLGRPGDILLSAGLSDREIRLYGNKVMKKIRKHGFAISSIKNLPVAINHPIAVFNNYGNEMNRAILTELKTPQGNVLATIEWGKGTDAELNIVTSVFGKGKENVIGWINKGYATYISKEKALDYLRIPAPIAGAQDSQELSTATKIVKEFENPSIGDENLQRGGDGAYTDEELSYENDPIAKWLGKSNRSKRQQKEYSKKVRKHMVSRVKELAEQLHLDNVEIVTDTSTLEGRKARAKGWFSPKTGKIVVVIPNHKSIADVEQTVLHEAVAHYGLRKLFGKHFDDFLWNVYNNASEDVRREIAALAAKHGWDFPKATEEYLASLAEHTNFENAIHEGWFSKIKTFFMRMLAKAGVKLGVELGDNELRYILWRSYENLAELGRYRDVIEQAADITMQYELGVGNYANGSSGQQHVAEDLLRNSEMDDAFNEHLHEMKRFVNRSIDVYGLNSYEDIENLPFDKWIKWELMDKLNDPECKGTHYRGSIFIFPSHAESSNDLRMSLWHEIAHSASYGLGLKQEFKTACLDYLDLKLPNVYDNIVRSYNQSKWEEEAVAYLFEKTFELYGVEKLFSSKFVGRETISTVFREIIKYLKDGTGEYYRFRQTPIGSKSASEIHKGSGTAERNDSNDSFDRRRNSGSQEVWSSKTQGEEGRKLRIRGRAREGIHGVDDKTVVGKSLRYRKNEDVSYEKADESDVFFRDGDGGTSGTDGDGEVNAVRSATELYEESVANTLWNRLKEGWVDYLRSLNKLQKAIEKATGQKIEDFENVYQHALHKSSVDNREWMAMMKKYVEPLNDVIHEITHGLKATFRGGKITLEVIETYLNCKHGLERNDKFAMRDAEELVKKRIEKADKEVKEELLDAEKLRDRDLRKLADKRMKGLLDEASYEQAVKAAKEEYDKDVKKTQDARDKKVSKIEKKLNEYYKENRERDYSGLTEIFDPKVKGVRKGLTVEELEQLASEYVNDFEAAVGAHFVGKLWDKVREMNRFSLRKSYESGLISRDSYKRTLDMFDYYVPLRGFAGEKAADVYDYITEGTTPLNEVLKHAGGRTSRAANLIATMMNMGNSAITQGNKNRVKNRLLNLANNHDTGGLLTVSNQWYEKVGEDEWMPAQEPSFKEGMTAEEMRSVVEDYEEKMKEREAIGEVKRMKNGVHLNVRLDSKRKEYEHGVRVKRNGTEYVVWVNGNPKAAQAINGLLNPEIKHGFVLDNLRRLGRFVSKNVTAFSPKFIFRNLKRDVMSANVVGFAKYGAAYTARFNRHVSNNLSLVGVKNARAGKFSGIFDLYWRYEHGKLDMNVQRDRWFKEFIENGGETGYSQVWSIEDYQHELKKQLKKHRADSQAVRAVAAMGAGVEFLNRGIENVCRFAAYCASRESGMNVLESVRDAKEASVNFNKKGSGALGNAGAKALFMFLNPGIQGFVQQLVLTKKYPKRMLPVLGAQIALGAIAILWAQWVGDDDEDEDDYFNLNPHVRRSNFILRVGDHEYLRWDLPPDLRPWYGLGEIGASALAGKLKYENVPLALLTNFSQLLPLDPVNDKALVNDDENLMKGVFKNILRGTGAGSLADAYLFDEDFLGRQITGATEWNKLDPEWKRAGRNTSGLMVNLSKLANEATGGDDATSGWLNFNPSKLEHALKGTLGGWVDFPVSLCKGCEAFFSDDSDEKLDTRNYPIIGDNYIRTDNSRMRHTQTRTAYQWYKHEHDVFEHRLKTYDHEVYEGGVLEYAEKVADMYNSSAYVRYKLVDGYMNKVDDLYRSLKLTSDKNVQEDILDTIDKVKKEMVDSVEMMEKDGE